jgi:protein-S-isoprenylcysteine O-methyltransferase Ste14
MMQSDTSWVARMLAGEQERAAHIRALSLYAPIALCVVAYFLRITRIRTFASPLLSFLWALPALLILQRLNLRFDWWSFDTHTACVLGMPVALYLGWAIFWGLLPQLAWPKLDVLSIAIVAFSFDLLVMLCLRPALEISQRAVAGSSVPSWLIGEAVGILLVLVPAMLLFRWTENDTHLRLRASGQVILSGLIFLYLVPELVFALRPGTPGWQPMFTTSRFLRQLWLQILLLLAVPGISAVQEFATRGRGTPLPYDPPRTLVMSGIYRYCANPMQISCAAVMLTEALMLRNLWLVAAAVVSTIYSAGLAHWDEEVDLARRFGTAARPLASDEFSTIAPPMSWTSYRAAVPAWRVRWRPFTAGPPAVLYVAATCPTCRGVREFLEQRRPAGLIFRDAELIPIGSIRRLRYVPADGPAESGVVAFARALEHLNFAWAFCGLLLRLPVIRHTAQLLTDAAGFGPRTLRSTCSTEDEAIKGSGSAQRDRAGS